MPASAATATPTRELCRTFEVSTVGTYASTAHPLLECYLLVKAVPSGQNLKVPSTDITILVRRHGAAAWTTLPAVFSRYDPFYGGYAVHGPLPRTVKWGQVIDMQLRFAGVTDRDAPSRTPVMTVTLPKSARTVHGVMVGSMFFKYVCQGATCSWGRATNTTTPTSR